MLMAVDGPYALMVQPDDILISPREVDEHFGTMACFHSRYALGDSHNYMDKDDFLREMYLDTVGHDEAGLKRYEHIMCPGHTASGVAQQSCGCWRISGISALM